MTINERIKLNDLEVRDLMKSYLEYIFDGLCHGHISLEGIKELRERLISYKKEVNRESELLKKLSALESSISEEDLETILKRVDISNESTFNYYDELGDYYASNYTIPRPVRTVPVIDENPRIVDEIIGYSLDDSDLLEYFKGSEAFYYAMNNRKVLDAGKNICMYGTTIKEEKGIIRKIRMIVPPITNLKTALINVHEMRHALDLFNYIGKEYPEVNNFEEKAVNEEDKFVREYVRNK